MTQSPVSQTAHGTFQISLSPHEPAPHAPTPPSPVPDAAPDIARMHFTKVWAGDLSGEGRGEMLSVGDPASGTAAYVVLETFSGTLGGRTGGFAFQQYGTMQAGAVHLEYVVVPGSGRGELAGLTGTLTLTREGGAHRYALAYALGTP